MRSSCALVGKGKGPKVRTGAGGHVTTSGMPPGELLTLRMFRGDEVLVQEAHVPKGGHWVFDVCDYVQVEYNGSAMVICKVRTHAEA